MKQIANAMNCIISELELVYARICIQKDQSHVRHLRTCDEHE